MPPSNLDDRHLSRLRDHFARYGALPSYAGIGELVGFKAKTAAVKLAQRLTNAGYLRRIPGGKLAPASRFFELALFDAPVKAGVPESVTAQEASELMTFDSYLVETPSKTVLIRVSGDSMQDAAVLDGDIAVVERTENARQGQLVVAVIDGEFTLKELRFEDGRPVLIPHNEQYHALRPKQNFQIFGVVRGIVRRYRSGSSLSKTLPHGETM